MKRIKLKQKLYDIIDTTYLMEVDFKKYKDSIVKKVIKLIGNGYRRRQYWTVTKKQLRKAGQVK